MTDPFKTHSRGLTSPPENAVVILPADQSELAVVTRALFVGEGGDVAVRMSGGGVVTLANVPAGTLLPIRVDRVYATGTTAGSILGLW
ncbi:MAG TPA: hypothetical protein VES64_01880 [Allosphingosinicella sp.]|nr:hypothetical protein [Allosphingosinicella sp.]